MSTLRDVANLAGVSITTASLVANGKASMRRISPDTAKRVREVMETLNYVPNQCARLLRTNAADRPCVWFCWPRNCRPDLLGQRLNGLACALQQAETDCDLLLLPFLPGHLVDALEPVRQSRCSAVLVGAALRTDAEKLAQVYLPAHVILLAHADVSCSTVGTDAAQVGATAARLLLERGIRTCAVACSPEPWLGIRDRTEALLQTLSDQGAAVPPEQIFHVPDTAAGGIQAAERFCALPERPGALLLESDCMARGALSALLRRGISVPEEVSVLTLGTADPEGTDCPALSSFSLPADTDAAVVRTLTGLLAGGPPAHVLLESTPQLRETFF